MVINKKLVVFFQLVFCSLFCHAGAIEDVKSQYPFFYLGVLGGYGSTTWDGLVPAEVNQTPATNVSTPIRVEEGGGVWGILGGYELSSNFAVEVTYMHYPRARILFDSNSVFTFDHEDRLYFRTRTEMVNLMGKLMIYLPHTKFRLYSSAGIASVHRSDLVTNDWHLNPSFGLGLNYPLTERFMVELGGNYTAGYGEAQIDPSSAYFPFLYSGSLRLAYCF